MKSIKNEISVFNPTHMNMISDTFEIYHYRQPYFKALDFHNHDFYEFYIFLDGIVTYYIEEKVYDLCAGDILVIPPGKMHRPVIADPNALYERIVLWVNPSYIQSIDDEKQTLTTTLHTIEANKQYLIPIPSVDFDFITTMLHRLIHLSTTNEDSILVKNAYLVLLLDHIHTQLLSAAPFKAEDIEYDTIPEIIYYINEHLCEKLTLDDISNRFFISKYHLIRKFKAYTNATVYDYIIAKRIVLAKKLLREGVSATEACMQCGFTDYSNFYKSFQMKSGMTPAEFKGTIGK
ncbi:AraC family transcriptional regulator [Paludicola sp. MB14-C6]|uniref:AraC family transcriptional regulator n=1 Tax=Paludihabitans sp. MB14-C6 TaxID=3070656 RepID=UPI0027DAF11A|nr:AraC family transcriptional regulator [Paludicola sp. MB14-C6]WMJ23254.1 AraC family transcriptional regulator [Paludicola sp. MB14-C6]